MRQRKLLLKNTLRYRQFDSVKVRLLTDQFSFELAKASLLGVPIYYMDESGFDTYFNPDRGYAPKGEKVYGQQDSRHHTRTSIIAAYARENKALIAPMLFEGTCTSNTFYTWVGQVFLPEVSGPAVLVLDNAAFHKRKDALDLLEANGITVIFLPPYSPHLNPIEKVWANIKRELKATGKAIQDYFDGIYPKLSPDF